MVIETDMSEQHQMLPTLPIPDLNVSIQQFLACVEPLLNETEFEQTKTEAENFLRDVGPQLQQALLQWKERNISADSSHEKISGTGTNNVKLDDSSCHPHYLDRYWLDAYLSQRSPIAINTSPFFVLEDDSTPNRNSQVARATSLIISTLAFFRMWKCGELPPDEWKSKPLCMRQYNFMFGSTRIPGSPKDTVCSYPSSTHIVVLARGQVYWFNVLSADQQTCLPAEQIAENLRCILVDASSMEPRATVNSAVGVLTTCDRDTWAKARNDIEKMSATGAESLRVVDSSLFAVCLDATSPKNLTEASYNFLGGTSEIDFDQGIQFGTCINRWYDKTLQLVICENGVGGVVFEHSRVDGHTILRYASDMITDSIMRFAQSIRGGLPLILPGLSHGPIGADTTVKRIQWEITPDLALRLRQAEAKISDLINQTEVQAVEFLAFGKRAIVEQKMSPDAFVQMGIQLAYYRLYGTYVNSYETVMTKTFHGGRTEPVRPVTKESIHFCETMQNAHVSHEAKLMALKAGLAKHSANTGHAARANAFDRHLFALSCLARESLESSIHGVKLSAMPEIFATPGWVALQQNMISTSNCGNPSLRLFGFGPVVHEGFGLGYLIKDDGIHFSVSSRRRQTSRFAMILQKSLMDMMHLAAVSTTSQLTRNPSTICGSVAVVPRSIPDSTLGNMDQNVHKSYVPHCPSSLYDHMS